jgi:short-subunit dehydrogenase
VSDALSLAGDRTGERKPPHLHDWRTSRVEPVGAAATSRSGWAVVTGASSGLGQEFALALAKRGNPVLAVARRGERLRTLAVAVSARGGRLEPLVADLATSAGIEALLERARSLDVELLVNNAGVAVYGPFASAPAERERGLVRLNVEAIVALTRGLLPQMLARGRGGVINVASQMAFQPMPYFAAYAASKAFVLSFSEALAEELRDSGVGVTAVAPGFISTEFTSVAGSQAPERRFPHLQPGQVVESALRSHERGRTVKVVGPFYVFLSFVGRFAPRAVLRRMMGRVLRPALPTKSESLDDNNQTEATR